jgi:hypothetical protein
MRGDDYAGRGNSLTAVSGFALGRGVSDEVIVKLRRMRDGRGNIE